MQKKYSENKWFGLLIAGVITLFMFTGCLASTLVLWGIGRVIRMHVEYWVIIEALATAFATAAVIGVGYFAYQELEETAKMRYIEVADRLFQELNSEENTVARRWLYNNITREMIMQPEEITKILAKNKGEGRRMIKYVLNSLDRVAFLTQNGWIPEEIIMPWMNPMVVKIWEKIGPFVEFERARRENEPDYYWDAQELAERCVAWREKKYGYEGIKWMDEDKVL